MNVFLYFIFLKLQNIYSTPAQISDRTRVDLGGCCCCCKCKTATKYSSVSCAYIFWIKYRFQKPDKFKAKTSDFFLLNVLYGQAYPVLKFKVDLTVNLLNTQPLKDSVLYLLLHKIATETLYTLYKNIIYNMNSWIFFFTLETLVIFFIYILFIHF